MIARVLSFIFLCLAIMTSVSLRDTVVPDRQPVPVAPDVSHVLVLTLGDRDLAYRAIVFDLQNMGNTGGRYLPLAAYDYQRLDAWLRLALRIDPTADAAPYLAAYYFGATRDPVRLRVIVDFLTKAGETGDVGRWQWLAVALIMARHGLADPDLVHRLQDALRRAPDAPASALRL
jgi:hypothetical protein